MPRTLTEQEFNAIKDKILEAAPSGLKEEDFNRYAGPAMEQAIGQAENSPKPVEGSAIARFAAGAWKNLNPMGIVNAAVHPLDTLDSLTSALAAEREKARQAFKEGRYSEAAGHAVASVIPGIGPAAAHAGEAIASGDVAGGIGEGAGLIGAVESPRLVKVGTKGVNAVATKIAESEAAQKGLGAVGGAVAGSAVGHPYLGVAAGSRFGPGFVKSMAESAEALTGGKAPDPVVARGAEMYTMSKPAQAGGASGFAESASGVKGPIQATYTQLPDGSWGLKGAGLVEGDRVNVMNRAGVGQMHEVGKVLENGTAEIAGSTKASAPSTVTVPQAINEIQSLADSARVKISLPEALAASKFYLEGMTKEMALEAVLKARKR